MTYIGYKIQATLHVRLKKHRPGKISANPTVGLTLELSNLTGAQTLQIEPYRATPPYPTLPHLRSTAPGYCGALI